MLNILSVINKLPFKKRHLKEFNLHLYAIPLIIITTLSFTNAVYAFGLFDSGEKVYENAYLNSEVPIQKIQELHKLSFKYWSKVIFSEDTKNTASYYNIDLHTLKVIALYRFQRLIHPMLLIH
jgi:hypothetical protein